MTRTAAIRVAGTYAVLLLLSVPIGTVWHEVVGHGLVGMLCGGWISSVEVLGMQLWPKPEWHGWPARYGSCGVEDIPTATRVHLTYLAGSMSTWFVAVAATILLCVRRRQGVRRMVLICLSVWWIDLLTYTLPSWGLRRSILWGPVYSEPYEAAVALGVPGPVFQAFALVSSMLLMTALIVHVVRESRIPRQREQRDAASGGVKP